MVKIIIMDDNRSLGAYLKKMLASEAHAVTLVSINPAAIMVDGGFITSSSKATVPCL